MPFIWERVSLQRIHIVADIDKRVYSRILNTFEVFLEPMNLPSTDLKIASHLGFLKVTIDNKSKPQTAETLHPFKRTDGKAIAKLIAAYDSPELRPIFTPKFFWGGGEMLLFFGGSYCNKDNILYVFQLSYHM